MLSSLNDEHNNIKNKSQFIVGMDESVSLIIIDGIHPPAGCSHEANVCQPIIRLR
jgi:hypothetical protein